MQRPIPNGAAILLASIREIETGKADRSAYDVTYGHKQGLLKKPLTKMTYGEIIDAQKTWSTTIRTSRSMRCCRMRSKRAAADGYLRY